MGLKRNNMGRVKRIWYLSPMRAAKVQASLRIRAVSPEPPLLAHTSNDSRGTFRQSARSLAPLHGWTTQLKFVLTESSKTQIRLTGLNYKCNHYMTTVVFVCETVCFWSNSYHRKTWGKSIDEMEEQTFSRNWCFLLVVVYRFSSW